MKEKCLPYAYWAAFIASLGGFLQSYVTCVIAGALCFICKEFSLSSLQEGFAASVILLGALLGTVICGYLADRLGRRLCLLIAAFLYLITSLPILLIETLPSLLILRFTIGIAVGMTSTLCPLYLAEIAPASKRGAFVTSFQFLVSLGTLAAYGVNLAFATSGNWRSMLALAAAASAFQGISLFFFPESPKWLVKVGENQKAGLVLKKLYSDRSLSTPLSKETIPGIEWRELFNPSLRFILFLGLALSFLQQGCGINAVTYFTPKIFKEAGFETPNTAMIATLVIGIINLLSTFYSFFLVDKIGRRKLLIISQWGVAFCLAFLSLSFATHIEAIDLIAVIALMVYIGSYSLGLGPVIWVVLSEIYPSSIRAKALSIMTFFSWASNYLVVLTFPHLLSFTGISFTLLLYLVISAVALWIFYRYLPETKGKSLEELEKLAFSKR